MLCDPLNNPPTPSTLSPPSIRRAVAALRRLVLFTKSALLLGFASAGAVYAGQSTVDICHVNGQGTFQLLTIAASAYDAHIAHGDKAPEHFFRDADGDGFGSPLEAVAACDTPEGYVEDDTDCDDTNAEVYPGAEEVEGNDIVEDCDAQLRLGRCPCEGQSVGQTQWRDGFGRGGLCEVLQGGLRVAAAVATGESTRAALASFAADSAGNLFPTARCSIYDARTDETLVFAITEGQAQACMQSLRDIAESARLVCE